MSRGFKLVIAGGGSAGLSMTNILSKTFGGNNVALVEQSANHYYQPLWTLVGGGHKKFEDSFAPLKPLISDRDVTWIQQRIAQIDPDERQLTLNNGEKVSYDVLILALGCSADYSRIPGLVEGLESSPNLASNYHPKYCQKTSLAIRNTTHGRAIFTHPNTPIKCAGASQKIMYLAEDCWRRESGNREEIQVTFASSNAAIFGVEKYARALSAIAKERNINTLFHHNLVSVDHKNNVATFQITDGPAKDSTVDLEYAMMHVTPPQFAPLVIRTNQKLAAGNGYLDVSPGTLQHNVYKDIWGIGDNCNLPTSKTCAAVAAQTSILEHNLKRYMQGSEKRQIYDGYTSCPVVTGKNTGLLCEFDSKGQPLETFPFPRQERESALWYHVKASLMPPVYWHLMIKGYWRGPEIFRRLFHLNWTK